MKDDYNNQLRDYEDYMSNQPMRDGLEMRYFFEDLNEEDERKEQEK